VNPDNIEVTRRISIQEGMGSVEYTVRVHTEVHRITPPHGLDNQMTSMTAEAARKTQLRKAHAMETAERSQKRGRGLQKLGRAVCRMPVRFRLATAAAADPALIIASENTCHVGSR